MKSQVLNELCEVVSRRSFKAPSTIKQYIRGMTECRTTRYGGRVVQCSDCGKTQVLYNSCNKRGCPICYRHRQKQWESHVKNSDSRVLLLCRVKQQCHQVKYCRILFRRRVSSLLQESGDGVLRDH